MWWPVGRRQSNNEYGKLVSSGKWLAERDVEIHSSFKRQAAIEFDNFNPKAEQYTFFRNFVIPTDEFEIPKNKSLMTKLTLEGNPTYDKEINDKDLPKSGIKNSQRSKLVERWMEKRVVITTNNDEMSSDPEHSFEDINEMDSISARSRGKRKVCFLSLKNKTIFFNPNHAPARQTESAESSRKINSIGELKQRKKPGKNKEYRPKSIIPSLIVKPTQSTLFYDQNKGGDLTINVGHLSLINPQLHIQIEDHTDSNPDFVNETQDIDPEKDEAQIANTKGAQENCLQIASYEVDMTNKEVEDAFKVKLIQWLEDNNLKLATTIIDLPQQMAAETASDQVGIGDERFQDNGRNNFFK
ncbi:hypothetical protein E5676_scaffold606G001870 [Cucumis melo var. makuwa]|uniref:Uncharacterized protein n=2 Tax=Cucumis melo TaxID=3656 RepID=A0A5D3C5Y8_CUCMM|nr:hypothetical protein E6C27_scaffold132G00460 [Cucumis melo var. makuwa]TYK07287.1 hypothetical protein E5676_scaffold606G001870 [Cucumis melo var. makuwa]